jgi:hypothetical protein
MRRLMLFVVVIALGACGPLPTAPACDDADGAECIVPDGNSIVPDGNSIVPDGNS